MFKRFRDRLGRSDLRRTRIGALPRSGAPLPAIRALEPRFVFDGAAAAAAADASHSDSAHPADPHQTESAPGHATDPGAAASHAESRAPAQAGEPSAAPGLAPTASGARHEIVVIDRAVPDLQILLDGVPRDAQVILIDSGRDGLDQLAEALRGRSDIDAIHILSHGTAGDLRLGTAELTSATIVGRYADDLATIGRALTTGGDLLIYGCDFAAGETGAEAARLLARATGADVAASTDATGDAALGGDWTLEASDGPVESGVIVDAAAREGWHHLLAPLTIAVNGAPTVRDGAGTAVTTTRSSNNVSYLDVNSNVVGANATWANVGTVDGVAVSLRATVVARGQTDDTVSFATSGDDATILVRATTATTGATNQAGQITLRWDIVRADNGAAVAADFDFQIGDIDGIGGNPNTRETVTPAQAGLTSYALDSTSDLRVDTANNRVVVSGTQNETASPPASVSIVRFGWTNTASWQVTYDLVANATTGQAAFQHDGNRTLTLADPQVKLIPKVDLDQDDSSGATGTDYRTTYTEKGPPTPIADTDPLVTNTAATVEEAKVVLTNAKASDRLTIGTLPATITGSVDTSVAGVITVTLTGNATPADYQAALRAIMFDNSSAAPDTTDRLIDTHLTSDGVQGTSSRTTLAVTAVNDAPVNTLPPAQSLAEDSSLVFSSANANRITVFDADAGSGALTTTLRVDLGTLTLGSLAGATVSGNGTGTVTVTGTQAQINAALDGTTYRPVANYNGPASLQVTTDDGGNAGTGGPKQDVDTLALTVTPVDDAPVNTVPAGPQAGTEDTRVVFSTATGNPISVSDPDGGVLTVTLSTTKGLLTLSRTTGLTFLTGDGTDDATIQVTGSIADLNAALDGLGFAPTADYAGNADILIRTVDPKRAPDNFTNGSFENPNIGASGNSQVDETTVPGWDTDASDGKIEIWRSGFNGVPAYDGNQFVEINATQVGALFQTFQSTAGSTLMVNFAHRGRNGTDTMQVVATDLGADGVLGTSDDAVLLQENFSDGNAAWGAYTRTLTQSATGNAVRFEFRSVSAAGNNPSIGNFIDGIQIDQFNQARDTVSVSVSPVADIVPDSIRTDQDTAITANVITGTNGASADSFENSDARVTAVTQGAHGSVAFQPDGRVTYTPEAGYSGQDRFTYTVTSGGVTETTNVDVDILRANAPPVNTLPGGQSVAEDTDLIFSAAGSNAITIADADAGTAAVTTSLTVGSGTLTLGTTGGVTVSGDGTGTVTLTGTVAQINAALDGTIYRPAANRTGTVTLGISTSDNGNTGAGGVKTDSDSLAITITPVNDAPTAGPLPDRSSNDGQAVSLDLTGNFRDVDGDRLTYDDGGTLPPGLSLDPATGLISGTVSSGASGPTGVKAYAVTLTVTDPSGATDSTSFTWRIANVPPSARNDTATLAEDTPTTIDVIKAGSPAGTAGQDTDPDGDVLTLVGTGALAPSAGHGNVAISNGALVYTPDADFNGTDTITYTVSDGNGGLSSASVAVTVTAVNDAPTATTLPDTATRDNQTVRYDASVAFSDKDIDPTLPAAQSQDRLRYTASGLPPGLSIDPDTGAITGTLPNDASVTPTYGVTVTATDLAGASISASFTWRVDNTAPMAGPDSATTPEGTPVTVDVIANDVDDDTFVLVNEPGATLAGHGSVSVNTTTGEITYTPEAAFNGDDTITYTLQDAQGARATGTLVVTVTPVENAPVATGTPAARSGADGQNIGGGGEVAAIDFSPFFTDADGDALTYASTTLPPGLSIDPTTGIVTGTIDRGASGLTGNFTYPVTITATDPSGNSADAQFIWTVVNPPPTASDDSAATSEGQAITIDVIKATSPAGTAGQDTDPDGDALSVVPGSLSAAHGTVSLNPDGTLRYVPDAEFNGTDTILYTVEDANGGRSSAVATVTVSGVNDAPDATQAPDRSDRDADPIDFSAGTLFSDRDPGDRLTYSATGLPPGLLLDTGTGRVTGRLAADASTRVPGGTYAVTLTATDLSGASASTGFTWTITDLAPVAVDDRLTTAEDTPLTGSVIANDSDPDGDALSVDTNPVQGPAHGTLVLRPDGTFTYTPAADFNGSDSFTYTLRDADGATTTATAFLTVTPVNDAPTASAAPVTTAEDTPVDGSVTARDVDGDPLGYAVETPPASGTLVLRPDGTFTYIPNPDANGGDSFAIRVSDGQGGSTLVTVPITVTPVNDAPTASAAPLTTAEDTPVDGSIAARDVDGDPLGYAVETPPANGTLVLRPDGTFTYTPNPDANGSDSFAIRVSDGQGGSTLVTVPVTVSPVNDAPTAGTPADRSGQDGQTVTLDLGGVFSDRDGDALVYGASGLPPGLSIDPATGRVSGRIDPAASGPTGSSSYRVTLTATDPSGARSQVDFGWSVVDLPPVAADDTATTTEDRAVDIAVLANDTDPDGDPLSVVAGSLSATHGTVSLNPDGTLRYVPDPDFAGTDTILYTVEDGNGGRASAVVSVSIGAVNDAPDATQAPDRSDRDGGAVDIAAGALFSDRDPGDRLTYSATGLPPGLVLDSATGRITGRLADDASAQMPGGSYAVTVTATDLSGTSTTTGFTWSIARSAPTAADDRFTTAEDTPLAGSLIANDSDPYGVALVVDPAPVQGPAHGTLVLRPDGSFTYTPAADFNGSDSFTYTLRNADGFTATATAVLTVTPVNDAPDVFAPPLTITAGTRGTGQIAVVDRDGDPVTIKIVRGPQSGSLTLQPDGRYTYDPSPTFLGRDGFSVAVTDGQGGETVVEVGITVAPDPVTVAMPAPQLALVPVAPFVAPPPRLADSVSATGYILTAVSDIRGLNTISDTVLADGAVLAAVNGASSLRGSSFVATRPVIQQEADRLGAIARDRFDDVSQIRTPWFTARPYLGRSLGLSLADETGRESPFGEPPFRDVPFRDLALEAIRRPDALELNVRGLATQGSQIVSVRLRSADGGPAPGWIESDGIGKFWGNPPAGTQTIALEVAIALRDGRIVTRAVTVDAATAEIRALPRPQRDPDDPAVKSDGKPKLRSEIRTENEPGIARDSALFSRQLAETGDGTSREIDLIVRALADRALADRPARSPAPDTARVPADRFVSVRPAH